LGKFHLGAQYTWLNATYQSAETVNGTGNSSNDAASSGTPGLEGSMVATSGAFARGNENNVHQPDGTNYLGSGQSVGYAIFNLGANFRVTPQRQLKSQVNNLSDTSYSTAAQLGPTGFDANGNFVARALGGSSAKGCPVPQSTFYAPGAPRMIWISLRYAFDKPN
jgi:outer membrane receptor for ferrienterochelin and colicin